MTTETNTTESRTEENTAARAVDDLVRIGRIWASHGIGVGRSALAASAETLRLATQALDALKGRLDGADAERDSNAA